jgi:hypothetical protein
MGLETGLLAGFSQGFEKILPVRTVREDVLTPVAAGNRIVNGPGIFHPHFARPGRNPAEPSTNSMQNEPNYGLTPFPEKSWPKACYWLPSVGADWKRPEEAENQELALDT